MSTRSIVDEAKKAMTPKDNEKCYKIHGFTARENVPMEYWLSDGSYVIVPANEVRAITELSCRIIVAKFNDIANE